MTCEYYNLWFRLDKQDAYLIWFNGKPDGVVTNASGKAVCFLSNEELLNYAVTLNLSVDTKEAILYDLDYVDEWLKTKDAESVSCKNLLDAWNLFTDVSVSTGSNFDADRKLTNKIYEKLFWGNNLHAVTPIGKSYEPIWTKCELKIIQDVLSAGLSMFREKIACT